MESAKGIQCVVGMEGNEKCNDCSGEKPKWVLTNNAVLICGFCAKVHQKFNNEDISTVKSIEVDSFSKEEIEILMLGGNKRFTMLMNEYMITSEVENYNELKYHLGIAEYYRRLLKLESKKEKKLIKKPLIEEGIKIVDVNESGIMKMLSNVGKKINFGIEAIGEVIASKANQMGIDEKIKEVSTFLSNKINNNDVDTTNQISNEDVNTDKAKTKMTKDELSQLLKKVIEEYKSIKQKRNEQSK